jgi:hypothetical protein
MSPAVFEPAILTSERPQSHALDRAATGIGKHHAVLMYKGRTVKGTRIFNLGTNWR